MTKNSRNTKAKESLEIDLEDIAKRPEIQKILAEQEMSQRQKIEELKAKIKSGKYAVSSEKVAKAIISHVKDDE